MLGAANHLGAGMECEMYMYPLRVQRKEDYAFNTKGDVALSLADLLRHRPRVRY